MATLVDACRENRARGGKGKRNWAAHENQCHCNGGHLKKGMIYDEQGPWPEFRNP